MQISRILSGIQATWASEHVIVAYTVCGKECRTWLAKLLVTEILDLLPVKGTIYDLAGRYMKAMGLGTAVNDLRGCISMLEMEQAWEIETESAGQVNGQGQKSCYTN